MFSGQSITAENAIHTCTGTGGIYKGPQRARVHAPLTPRSTVGFGNGQKTALEQNIRHFASEGYTTSPSHKAAWGPKPLYVGLLGAPYSHNVPPGPAEPDP